MVRWRGKKPEICQKCGRPLHDRFYDAKTRDGVWGLLCLSCFADHGLGLGKGLGQEFDVTTLRKLRG